MNKKGFTLIELLAVIVILAIIAVITVPKIADMITSSRKGGAEDSFYGTLKAAELGYAKALQSNTDLKGSTCNIEDSKITCTNGVKISVSGKTPESGTLVIDSAGSTIAKSLTLNGYKCYGDLSTESPCLKTDVDVASETLIKKVTTSGDGLYKDTYEEGRYVYKGKNPSNYITFNNKTWRILSIENDGTLKIMKTESIGNIPWDTASSINWARPASLNTYLNTDYYNTLTSKDKGQIQIHSFGIGSVTHNNKNLEEQITAENKITWTGNIGIMSAGDYLLANTNDSQCGNMNLNNTNYNICEATNYLYSIDYPWVISPVADSTNKVFYITSKGVLGTSIPYQSLIEGKVYPTLYLKSNLQISGSGTSDNPYKISS